MRYRRVTINNKMLRGLIARMFRFSSDPDWAEATGVVTYERYMASGQLSGLAVNFPAIKNYGGGDIYAARHEIEPEITPNGELRHIDGEPT